MLPPIGEDLAHEVIVFKIHHHAPGLLKDLQRCASHEINLRYSRWETVDCGIIRFGNSYGMRPDVGLGSFELFESPCGHRRFVVRQGQGGLENRVLALIVGRAPRTPPHTTEVWCRGHRGFYCSLCASARTGGLTTHRTGQTERRE